MKETISRQSLSEPGTYEAELTSSEGTAFTSFEVVGTLNPEDEEIPWDQGQDETPPWEEEEPPEEQPEEVSPVIPWDQLAPDTPPMPELPEQNQSIPW